MPLVTILIIIGIFILVIVAFKSITVIGPTQIGLVRKNCMMIPQLRLMVKQDTKQNY